MSYHAHNGVGAAPQVAAVLHHLARHAHHGDRFARLHLASPVQSPRQVTSMMTVAQMMAQDAAGPRMVAARSSSQRLATPKPHAMPMKRVTLAGLGTLPPFGGWGSAVKRLRMVGGNYFF
jgi:hypothetical protein